MSIIISAAEQARIDRLVGIECYIEAMKKYIDSLRGYSVHTDWTHEDRPGGGLAVIYSRDNCSFEFTIDEPVAAINIKAPLQWTLKLKFRKELIAEMPFTIETMGRVELWTTLSHMSRFNRKLIHKGNIAVANKPHLTGEEKMRVSRELNVVEYQSAKIMATGIFALFTHELNLARKIL